MDWTKLTDDPNNSEARSKALQVLVQRRAIHTDVDLMDYLVQRIGAKRVLDIGVVSHTMDYVTRKGWRHAIVAQHAGYCLGLDILEEPVRKLSELGYNVRVADATSDADLGEFFDIVFIGDVVEHVDNPVNLLKFAGRHLAVGGSILVATPNPFSRKFYRRFRREGTSVVNLDHVAWITPSMAMEIGRRAGLELAHYHLVKKDPAQPVTRMFRRLARRFAPIEFSFPDFLYEFRLPAAD